jgi:hypothetical protein
MPAPWLQIQLGQHTAIDLPERIDRKVLAELKFKGVSAAMMPDGTLLYNEARRTRRCTPAGVRLQRRPPLRTMMVALAMPATAWC